MENKSLVLIDLCNTLSGLSFEASCHRNSTYTLYSAAGYFLCIKDKKCVIYSQSRYRDNDHVFFHYQSLIIVMTIDLSIVNNASKTGRRITIFSLASKSLVPVKRFPFMPVRWTNPVKINSVRKNIGFHLSLFIYRIDCPV